MNIDSPKMLENLHAKHCIRTYTGIYVNIAKPEPEMFVIEDIAHSLSLTPRFVGSTEILLSVAEHSLAVSQLLPDELKLTGLLHDSTEAYICDIPGTVKSLLPDYRKIEQKLYDCIAHKFNLLNPIPQKAKAADVSVLQYEWNAYMLKNNVAPIPSKLAEQLFLDNYCRLIKN